jgi:hypothetical protein
MLIKDLQKKVLLTHADVPEKVIGYEKQLIENGIPHATEILIILSQEGDFGILTRCYNSGAKILYKVKGCNLIDEYKGEFTADLEQFCRTKHKTEMTLDKVKTWFHKNARQFGPTAIIINTILNLAHSTTELEETYRNICIALGYDPKPFSVKQSDIEEFNTQLGYIKDNRNDREYFGDDVRKTYNWKDEYEEHPIEPTNIPRKLSSYNSYCKKTYNIISEKELCTVLAYAMYLDNIELPENVYKCECGAYNKYRTADVEWDNNNGRYRTYPDRDVCCPNCGALKPAR